MSEHPLHPNPCSGMHPRVTAGDNVQREVTRVRVGGRDYVGVADAARIAGVARQTLWRWRRAGKVPPGLVYRDKQVLYTVADVAAIKQYAQRIIPAGVSGGAAPVGHAVGGNGKGRGR